MSASLRDRLLAGAAAIGLELSTEQVDRLIEYLALIQKWNQVYNLTALREPDEMLTHHLLDSLAVVRPLRRQLEGRVPAASGDWRLLDVGSGAGLPGVVIAICCPDIDVSCVDTVGKKARFLQQVAMALRLPNLRGLHSRVEQIADRFDVVSSRAFASLADFTRWSQAALAESGIWMAMKGKRPEDELGELGPAVEVFHVEQLAVPGLDAERCIVWMRQQA